MLRILNITKPDILQGLGIRCSIWVSGCSHHCKNCQNKWTWDYNKGQLYTENKEEIHNELNEILSKDYYRGVTISGGDPLFQPDENLKELIELIDFIKETHKDKDIWIYTGFTYKQLKEKNNQYINEILSKVNVIVDGKFEDDLKDISLAFRGSKNQCILMRNGNDYEDVTDKF